MRNEWFSAEYKPISGAELQLKVEEGENGWFDLCVSGMLENETPVGDWRMCIRPNFEPDFFYTPHLTPEADNVIDMHVFRAPVMMMGRGDVVLCVLPVMDGVQHSDNRVYMDFDAPERAMMLGITTTRIGEHVLYHRTDKAVLPAGEFVFRAKILIVRGEAAKNPFRPILAYYWERYGHAQAERLPAINALEPYVKHTYEWAFDRWKEIVWQEFELNGRRVGAPQMIVTTRQSPNYGKPTSLREPVAIWNQAWFCSLRSAQGVYRYGKRVGREDYVEKARMTKELALQFPQEDGLFDSVIGVPSVPFEVDGETYWRGGDWKDCYFGNSNRNPVTSDLARSPKHILDMSWAALYMLSWYEELEKDERLVDYVVRYADRLLTLQDADGYFPAWIDCEDGHILPELRQSPESAVSVTLLLRLYRLTGKDEYRAAALRCMDVLVREVMPESRWEDFETYWSCSRFGSKDMVGRKFERNASYKQCSLSPFYMAQALLECYLLTQNADYLAWGERCLDEMLMYQSAYQPDYIPITVVGGFGVMNCDAELNDARQSLFSDLIVQYGRILNRSEYVERGEAALRATFSMMYCPENPIAKEQWEKRWPFLNELDYGFMMENYGHDGYIDGTNLGIGEFTIYDWGNGAGSAGVLLMLGKK